MLVQEVMQPEALCVDAAMPTHELARVLLGQGITGAPVLENGHLVGVVSLHDLVRHPEGLLPAHARLAPRPFYFREPCADPELDLDFLTHEVGTVPVRSIMTTALYLVEETDTVSSAIELMLRANIHRVLVRSATGVPGILTTTDLLKVLLPLLGDGADAGPYDVDHRAAPARAV